MKKLALAAIWTIAWWTIAWSHVPFWSQYAFFPLWFGFILTTNALADVWFGDSLMRRMGWRFSWLFIISMPMWWFFEYLNSFVQNWHYLLPHVSQIHFIIESSIDFSTVVPAVLSATFLVARWFGPDAWQLGRVRVSNVGLALYAMVGLLGFWAIYAYPLYAFPLVWIAPLFILDSIGYSLKLPVILRYVNSGRWLVPISAALAALCTGFFWEMWNFYSFPQWYYTVPWVGFWKIFEMPLLGFGGYLPFGLLVWSYSILALKLFSEDVSQVEPFRSSEDL